MALSKRQSFERKILELSRVAELLKQGKRPEGWYPETLQDFRAWECPGEFEGWVSKAVDAPSGDYPELAQELRKVFETIDRYSITGLRETIRLQAKEISVLARQNLEMESLVRELSDKLEVAGKLDVNDRSKIIRLYR